jgi:U3 small nucleolar RNA-associated protein 6
MNPESIEMWIEYLKMELGFIETLRRRWDALGIKVGEEEEGAGTLGEEYGGTEARRAVMEGGIVESVISNAGKGEDMSRLVCEDAD